MDLLAASRLTPMKVITDGQSPYADTIRNYLVSQVPSLAVGSKDKLEAVASLILGTNNTRYGPLPVPEVQVNIRSVIRTSIETGSPIPVLIPWGGRKADWRHNIDIAEVAALKGLTDLHNRVREYHAPGLHVVIRLEDTGAFYMFRDSGLVSEMATKLYTQDFQKLTKVLGVDGWLEGLAESTLMDLGEYTTRTQAIQPVIYNAFSLKSEALDALERTGWKGGINDAQVRFYLDRYKKLYPSDTPEQSLNRVADYFAASLVRYQMKGTGAPSAKFITISYVPPIPGAPDGLTSQRVYYRTLPEKAARTHIAPWRAKGYLRIGAEATPKLAPFSHLPEDIHICTTTLADNGESVKIATDYVLA